MTALLTQSHLLEEPVGEGDCGIVLKPDGTFRVFSTGELRADIRTNTDITIRSNMEKLMSFAVALQTPPLMQILLDVLHDNGIVQDVLDVGKPN